MLIVGIVLMIRNPELLRKRLNAKEKEAEQKSVILFGGLMFVIGFVVAGLDYLKSAWTAPKIVISLAVPLFFFMLLTAAWKRNWRWLLGVIIGAAVLKIIWSVAFSGEAGMSILKPALLGLIICICGLGYYFKKHGRANKN
jgi:protein-S-isoprenylcysteine O-methyltransferase Ste14